MLVLSPLTERQTVRLLEQIPTSEITELYGQPDLRQAVAADFEGITQIGFYECSETGLRFFHPCVAGSEAFYNRLNLDSEIYYPDNKSEYLFASQFVSSEDAVLEIGAGKGAFCKYIQPQTYLGLEFSETAIEMAARQEIELRKETIEQHASSEDNRGKYSVAVAFQVLEHVTDPAQFVQSTLDCLDENGILIISVPSEDAFYSTRINDVLNLPPHHVTRWSDRALMALAKQFNLEVIEIYHEKLSQAEQGLFLYCISLLALLNFLGIKKKLVDSSLKIKLISKVASALSRFLLGGFQAPGLMPNGHSVTVVYRKQRIYQKS